MAQTKAERFTYIRRRIQTGISDLQSDPRYDWQRDSEEIHAAAEALTEAELQFKDGKIGEDAVRERYKAYTNLHLRER